MVKFYSDFWECTRINNISKNDPYQAKQLYDLYFQKYPYDYITYMYYSMLLVTINEWEKAKEIINRVQSLKDNNVISLNDNREHKLNKSIIYANLKLLTYNSQYKKSLDYYISNFEDIKKANMAIVPFYCRGKLEMLDKTNRDNNLYVYRQIIEYQYKDFLNHIKRHLPDYNVVQKKVNKYIFTTDFDLDTVITEVKKYIPSSLSVFPTFISDNYLFKYDCCGREGYKTTDYFIVVTFHGTKDIITMFPALFYTNIQYVDLNYLKPDNEIVYVRSRSQIDKFNKKYNLK